MPAASRRVPGRLASEQVTQAVVGLLGALQQIHQGLVLAARDHEQALIQERLLGEGAGKAMNQLHTRTAPAGGVIGQGG